jgi:hypothetical protein
MIIRSSGPIPEVTIEEVTDPVEIARFQAQREKADRNWAWFQEHIKEVYADANRGRHVCIAGQEMFVADSALEARNLGRAKHPTDDGSYVFFIPKERTLRI